MLSIDKKLADKIGDNFIIAREDDKPIYALLEMQTVHNARQTR